MKDSEIWDSIGQKIDELEDSFRNVDEPEKLRILARISDEFEAIREDIDHQRKDEETILQTEANEFHAVFNTRFPLADDLLRDLESSQKLEKDEAIKFLTALKAKYFS